MALPSVVGLDIGSYQMKAVELNPGGKEGLTVTALAFAPTPAGVLQGGILTDPQLLGQAVKQMLKEGGIRSRRVIGSLPGQSSIVVRVIEVPKMSQAELAETMKWEVERHVPFAPTEVAMDYQSLPEDPAEGENPNMSVLLAVAQREIVDSYVSMIFAAKLDPVAIDIEPLAAGRALLDLQNGLPVKRPLPDAAPPPDMEYPPAKETVAVVTIGASNTDISIFEDGQLIFPRSLSLGGDSITHAISDSLGYVPDQAERIKREHGSAPSEGFQFEAPGQHFGDEDHVDFGYSQGDEDFSNFRPVGLPTDDEVEFGPISQRIGIDTGKISGGDGDEADDLNRTQPVPRRTLDLARRSTATVGGGFGEGMFSATAGSDADDLKQRVAEAILPVLSELSAEIRRSLDYYRSRSQGRNVDRILLGGGTAGLSGFDLFLERELAIPVKVALPFDNITVTAKNFDPDYLKSVAPIFTVAVGLATREAVSAANPAPIVKKGKAGAPSKKQASTNTTSKTGRFKLPFGKKTTTTTATTTETTGS